MVQWDAVASTIVDQHASAFYDFHVPEQQHYLAEGMWHHNTGKSRGILEKLHALGWKYKRSRHLLLRQFRASLNETILPIWENHVLGATHPLVIGGAQRSHRAMYELPNGSAFVLGGIDTAERWMGGEFDTVTLFEATEAKEEKWEMALTRLRSPIMPYKQGIAECNPNAPGHWLNIRADRCKRRQCIEAGNCICGERLHTMTRLRSQHSDNPSLGRDYLERLASLTGVRRERLYLGNWVGAEGLCFDAFDLHKHVKTVPAGWDGRVVVGVDYGIRNPFCGLRGVERDGVLWLTAERYASYQQEQPMVAAISGISKGAEAIAVDPSAAALKLALNSAGLPVKDANNDVLTGIAKVNQRLADGRLFIDPSCVNLIREVQAYQWADNARKDVPIKEDDHACDAVRYLTMYLDCGTQPVVSIPSFARSEPPSAGRALAWAEDDDRMWTRL